MKIFVHNRKHRLNNSGAAIVTVIVVCAFISVIATTLIYVSARNYQMKQVDYQSKVSFYQSEECLDTLKGLLVQSVGDAFMYAYNDTMTNYADFKEAPNVDYYYAKSYTKRLEYLWKNYYVSKASAMFSETYSDDKQKATAAVKYFMTKSLGVTSMPDTDPNKAKYISMINCIESVDGFTIPPAMDKFIIVGVKIKYTSDNNYSSYISTDIGLELPEFNKPSLTGVWGNTAKTEYTTIDLTDCVKYMNWKRYD